MNNKTFAILTIGGSVVLLYVAYTGTLCSAWNGIKGNCPCGNDKGSSQGTGVATGTGQPLNSNIVPVKPGQPGYSGQTGNVIGSVRQAGDGSFQPSRQYLSRGAYNVSSTGGIRVSDAGQG